MGTSADKLNKLIQTKADIKNAIIEKGGVVNDSTPFGDYAQAIRDIEGGGGESGEATFTLNWNHHYSNPSSSNDTCAAGGILNGVMNCGAVGGQTGTSYVYKTFDNLPSQITSAKFIICASPTQYSSWNNQGCALSVWQDEDAGEKIVLQAQGEVACYWNGHTESWGQTDTKVSTNTYSNAYSGTDVIWWVYEFDGTNNYVYAIREKNGAVNPSSEIYPLTHESGITKTNVGEASGINGSFIGSSMRLFIGGEAKDETDYSNQSPYAGNIDLLRCRFFINGEELERPAIATTKAKPPEPINDNSALKLNWELQPHDENYNGNTGFITGSCLTGCYSGTFTPPKLVYTMRDVPDEITSAKLIICTGQVRYAWGDFWAITGGINDNNGNVIECLANASSYFGGYNHYSGVDTYGGYRLCSSMQSPYIVGGTALNWQTIEFDGTTNHIRCYRQENGAMNATNELYPLKNDVYPVEDIDAGQFTGINGSFIGEGFRVVLNNDVDDNRWTRGYNGNIDLLHTCLIINDEVISYAMEIVGKANVDTYLLNSNSNPLLNTVSINDTGNTSYGERILDLSTQDYSVVGVSSSDSGGYLFIVGFDAKKPVSIVNVVQNSRSTYPESQQRQKFAYKVYGSNSPMTRDKHGMGTLVAECSPDYGETAYIHTQKYGFRYFAIVKDAVAQYEGTYDTKFLITVQEKAAEKAGERFVLNAVFCGSQEDGYPLSNASDGDFATWWSHNNGSSAKPYIVFQSPALDIASSDRVKILASFYNSWDEHPTSLTVKAVSQEDMSMVQIGMMDIDEVGTTLATIDQELPSSKDLVKLTNYFEYRQVRDKLIVLRANNMNSGSFKVAEARIEVEPKDE